MDRDKWQEIWSVLGRNKVRTVLTGFGVFWGIFMLMIMMGSGRGLQNGTMAGFGHSVTNCVFIWTQQTSMPYKGFNRGRNFQLRNDDIPALKAAIPDIGVISPRCQAGGYRGSDNITRGVKTGAFGIYGDYPQYVKINPLKIVKGRYINHKDIEERRKVCFIGQEVYNTLYDQGEEAIGTYIKAQGVNYKVIGLFKSGNEDARRAEDEERSVFIPLTTFQQAYNWGDIIGFLSITSKDGVPVTKVEEEVKTVLKQRHSINPADDRAFGSWNMEEAYNRMMGLMVGIRVLSLVVGTLTLLAGAIGVSNIMLVVVRERTREFGVRRAIGASPASIISQVVLESVVLTVSAGILGIISGVWIMELVGKIMNSFASEGSFFRNPGVHLPVVLAAFGILVIAGILAGIIPARRAVEIRPVDALRFE